jgi:hypothetical protein
VIYPKYKGETYESSISSIDQTGIGKTRAGIGECRNGVKEREPSRRDVSMLVFENVIVSIPSSDIRSHNNKARQL